MRRNSIKKWGVRFLIALILGLLVWGAGNVCGVNFRGLVESREEARLFLANFFPFQFSLVKELLYPAWVTVLIAFLGTVIGALFSFAVAILASANLVPWWLRLPGRLLISLERGLPEIVLLLLLIAFLGLGPFPGVIALAIGCLGMLGRLFADAIEEVDPRIIGSLKAVGANPLQIIQYAILPQVLPSMIANTLFRFEINIRHSVLLGAIGAGGIGYEIFYGFQLLEYKRVTMSIVVILVIVFLAERLSDFLRKRMLEPQKKDRR